MASISFPVGSTVAYAVPILELTGAVHQIQATFENGDHVFTSSDFKLGTVRVAGSRALIGRLTFRYSYDSSNKIITVCGTNYPSADGMTMMTMPEGMDNEACFEHAAATGFLADEVYRGGKWNYYSPLMPGAPERIKNIVRAANDALISALGEVPDLTVRVREILPELPVEDYLALCFVTRDGRVLEKYDPTKLYGLDDELHTPHSTFMGKEEWPDKIDFANVIGSTSDPRPPSKSWLDLWRTTMERDGPNCASLGFPEDVSCSGTSVGGHVICGRTAQKVDTGSNDVRIIPICRGHNGRNSTYMRTMKERWVVVLNNYMQ
ncbi:hypothetical protein F4813DRAFT_389758 [Daldinia decipiens]|uniref:uncharacterized protein n=1 Tax=Daldinia decipiens TaxID=326647 RepID=UPI0020C51292|nr:uncharacterized protein F4813DRAFT_389758 [Daldinia decipiens]KAI1657175.1 hypothetical protein F4813DRAFT_389758 [Daldinia decipiens]